MRPRDDRLECCDQARVIQNDGLIAVTVLSYETELETPPVPGFGRDCAWFNMVVLQCIRRMRVDPSQRHRPFRRTVVAAVGDKLAGRVVEAAAPIVRNPARIEPVAALDRGDGG